MTHKLCRKVEAAWFLNIQASEYQENQSLQAQVEKRRMMTMTFWITFLEILKLKRVLKALRNLNQRTHSDMEDKVTRMITREIHFHNPNKSSNPLKIHGIEIILMSLKTMMIISRRRVETTKLCKTFRTKRKHCLEQEAETIGKKRSIMMVVEETIEDRVSNRAKVQEERNIKDMMIKILGILMSAIILGNRIHRLM